ncbi:MAG: DUF4240 domain-containing protein [Saprospiraceae bacterium]
MHTFHLPIHELGPDFIRDLKRQYPSADLEIVVRERLEHPDMDEAAFWRIIGLLDWRQTGHNEAVLEPAVEALAQLSKDAIAAFEDILSEKLWLLDTEAHARPFMDKHPKGRLSVDDFLYVRCCVVANGQAAFEEVLQHPEKIPDLSFGALLRLADLAHRRKTGKDLDHIPTYNYETYSNANGWI